MLRELQIEALFFNEKLSLLIAIDYDISSLNKNKNN